MTLGILEPKTKAHVPGTILLNEQAAQSEEQTQTLKHGAGKNSGIILAPQPCEDPNDPLNWSTYEKHLVLGILCLGSIVNAAAQGPLLAAGVVQIALELNVSFTQVALLTGYLLLATGATGPFVSAIARKYGKRPVYILSSLFSLVGCIIGETAKSYNSLLAARVVQGLGVSAYESLIMASIGDMYFVHERGPRVAVVMFILSAVTNGISIIAGVITANLGWAYNFHILVPFTALQFILVVLFTPETTYRRKHIYDLDLAGSVEDLAELSRLEARAREARGGDHPKDETKVLERQTSHVSVIPARKTFLQRLKPYNGVFVEDSIFKMLLACPVILANLGASYNVFVSGIIIAWFVAISVVSSIIFTAPPYLYTAAEVGYTSTGPLIGGILGFVFMAVFSDRVAKSMTQKNKGVYEPEFRLPLMAIGFVCNIAGTVGLGYAVQGQASVYLIVFSWGVMLFGMTISATVTTGYALDAFREYSTEIFVMNMVFKNFFYYGLTEYIIQWYFTRGAAQMFGTMAGISAAVSLTTLPLYVYGKRYRHHWHHHNIIKKLRLDTDKTGSEE